MITRDQNPTHHLGRIDRRRALRFGGTLVGGAALLAVPAAARAHDAPKTLTMDMACDGRTFMWTRAHSDDPASLPLPGDPFVVFGSLYPEGTIEQGLSGPDQEGAIGRWVCRGIFVVDIASGAVPHVISTVAHVLGDGLSASAGQVEQAPDALITEGFEGGYDVARRAIIGGYGEYAGLRGDVVQTFQGENDTILQLSPEVGVPAPNYTFEFTFE